MTSSGPFGAWTDLELSGGTCSVASLPALSRATGCRIDRLPFSIRVLLENALRHCGRGIVAERDVLALASWNPACAAPQELAFMPARVLLQDFTGVPCVVDLAALRSAIARLGGDPTVINPSVPVDLVIDHSVQVDCAAQTDACERNMELEMQRNGERYALLRWAQNEFDNLRVLPPGAGICHQVNLEYLAEVVRRGSFAGESAGADACLVEAQPWAYPDTVVGTDSHTTTINGLGVLGWGVGGIEAEAVMLGQPYSMLVPQVVGVRLSGALRGKAAATDAALTLTELLRGVGVVGRFVEFFGPGIASLSVPDRATIANMAPEYGATCGFFPVDELTVEYLTLTGRPKDLCDRVRSYSKYQGMLWEAESPVPDYSEVVQFDLSDVRPSLAGPRRPQQRLEVGSLRDNFRSNLPALAGSRSGKREAESPAGEASPAVGDGSVVIAAITSCTNTSNPALMMAAGIVARKAVEAGLRPQEWVKTSLTPGSRVVTGYLERAGLLKPLEQLGFDVAGYGCATCIGNSGPLDPAVAGTIERQDLVVAAVLSGNRNFEARIHPAVRANYLASPALVVAYALAGTVDIDLEGEPLGLTPGGREVFLDDLWPTPDELQEAAQRALDPELFTAGYEEGVRGTDSWRSLEVPLGALFEWDEGSTYVRQPPFLEGFTAKPAPPEDVAGARILALLGDSITTDHISPAGSIGVDTTAGRYLLGHGVAPGDFNTYGARRGNHEVLLRGTFANVRLRNRMAEGREGGWTKHHPSGELLPIYEAAVRYAAEAVRLVIFAGKEYGTGSSRDWAAKGTALLGVRAVVAESFERIHRSNLIGMGVLPVELPRGTTVERLALDGSEIVDVRGVTRLAPGSEVQIVIRRADGSELSLDCRARVDSAAELSCFLNGGVLPWVLRGKMERPCA